MDSLQNLVSVCQADEALLRQQAQLLNESWPLRLVPVSDAFQAGEDLKYDDVFQRIREEVNKLSGIDTGLVCQLAATVLACGAPADENSSPDMLRAIPTPIA
uniref:hypothetical protein n=1 Tax=Enterobacter cancerogenus TaxID=69218 RepID=UPI0026CFB5B9